MLIQLYPGCFNKLTVIVQLLYYVRIYLYFFFIHFFLNRERCFFFNLVYRKGLSFDALLLKFKLKIWWRSFFFNSQEVNKELYWPVPVLLLLLLYFSKSSFNAAPFSWNPIRICAYYCLCASYTPFEDSATELRRIYSNSHALFELLMYLIEMLKMGQNHSN